MQPDPATGLPRSGVTPTVPMPVGQYFSVLAPGDGLLGEGEVRRSVAQRHRTQVVALLRDASFSMEGKKGAAAEAASRELVTELAAPENRDGFDVVVIDFKEDAAIVQPVARASTVTSVPPLEADGACTNIIAGLQLAQSTVQQRIAWRQDGWFLQRPVVIALTDGQHNAGGDLLAVANIVKAHADVMTVAFGNDADEQSLRAMASSPELFRRCSSGRELRAFLAKVGHTLTVTMTTGANVAASLSRIT